jgi:hypothetical protein
MRYDYHSVPSVVQDAFDVAFESHECVDNARFALRSDYDSVAEYNLDRDAGCCGSYDEEMVVGTQTWLFGFNYGH